MLVISIIVPTRNEEHIVRTLATEVAKSLGGIGHEVIFVDDSTDRTPNIIGELMCVHENIRLIHRQGRECEGGLATAALRGISEARGAYICVMDADLQHPPLDIPRLLDEAQASDADIVVASRYREGGSYEGLTGPFRKFISIALKEFTKVLFFPRLNGVTDPLSGFFVVRRDILEGASLSPIGFKILLEILVRCQWESVREIPYEFAQRASGKSKATMTQGLSFLCHVARLFLAVPWVARFWKFGAVGGLVALIGGGILYLLVDIMSIENNAAYFVQAIVSLQLNFILNDQFTWADRKGQKGSFWSRWTKFHTARALSVGLSQILFALLTAFGAHHMLVYALTILFLSAVNFYTSDHIIFSSANPLAVFSRKTGLPRGGRG